MKSGVDVWIPEKLLVVLCEMQSLFTLLSGWVLKFQIYTLTLTWQGNFKQKFFFSI